MNSNPIKTSFQKRDEIALEVLKVLLQNVNRGAITEDFMEKVADIAYGFAEAMIRRSK